MRRFAARRKGLADERRIEAPLTWLNGLLRTARDGSGVLLPTGIWITLILAVVVAATLRYTRFGRHLFALGSNERTARLCGVRISRTRIFCLRDWRGARRGRRSDGVFEIVGWRSNGCEWARTRRDCRGDYRRGSLSGGRGSVGGTLAGAAIMAVIEIGCSQQGLPNWVQQIVTGSIIVGAVALDRWSARA